jgi:hypothetical protein
MKKITIYFVAKRTFLTLLFFILWIAIVKSQQCLITGEDHPCVGQEYEYSVTTTLLTNVDYQWLLPLGGGVYTPTNSPTLTVDWSQSGNWVVQCLVTDGTNSETCMLSVMPSSLDGYFLEKTGEPIYENMGTQYYCLGSQITLNVSRSEAEEIPSDIIVSWNHTGVNLETQVINNELSVTFIEPGSGQICATLTNADGCTSDLCFSFEVISIGQISFEPSLTIFNTNPLYVCKDQEVVFINTSDMLGNLNFEWQVTKDNTTVSYLTDNLSFTFSESGNYNILLMPIIGSVDCTFEPFEITVIVADETVLPILCPSPICSGDEKCYFTPLDCSTYSWNVTEEGSITQGSSSDKVCITWDNVVGHSTGAIVLQTNACNPSVCEFPSVQYIPLFPSTTMIDGQDYICSGNPFVKAIYTLTGSPEWIGVTYNWTYEILQNNSGSISSTTNPNLPTFGITGSNFDGVVKINLSVTKNLGECVFNDSYETKFIHGTVKGKPYCSDSGEDETVTIEPNRSEPINWIVTDPLGSIIYSIDNGNSSLTIPANLIQQIGRYNVFAMPQINGNSACELTGNFTVSASPFPPPFISGSTDICLMKPSMYSIPVSPGFTSHFIFHDGPKMFISIGSSQSYTWKDPSGPYIIEAYYNSTSGACESPHIFLEVHVAGSDIAIMGNQIACPDNLSPEIYMASSHNTSNTYTWSIVPSYLGSITGGMDEDIHDDEIGILWHNVTTSTNVTISVSTKDCSNNTISASMVVTLDPFTFSVSGGDICSGNEGIFFPYIGDPNSPITAESYEWYVNGVLIPNSNVAEFHYSEFNSPGVYQITCILTNPSGCGGRFSNSVCINVYAFPDPIIFLSDDLKCPPTDPFQDHLFLMTNEYPGHDVHYYWEFGGNQIGGDENQVQVFSEGVYQLILTVDGCTKSNTYLVQCGNPDQCSCTPDVELTIGYTNESGDCGGISLDGTVHVFGDDRISNLRWNIPGYGDIFINDISGLTPTETFYFPSPGYYVVKLLLDWRCPNGDICPYGKEKVIKIPYIADFTWSFECNGGGTYDVICNESTQTNIDLAPNAWQSGNINAQNVTTFTVPNVQPGSNISVSLTEFPDQSEGLGNYSCSKTHTIPVPLIPEPTFSINKVDFCEGELITFSPEDIDEFDIADITWNFGDGSTSKRLHPQKVYASVGLYTIILSITTLNGCNLTYQNEISVHANNLDGTITYVPSTCQTSADVIFNPCQNCSNLSYLWSTGDVSQQIAVHEQAIYSIEVSDNLGCSFNTSKFVPLFPFEGSILGSLNVCETLDLLIKGNEQGFTFDWEIYSNGNLILTVPNTDHLVEALDPGMYHIKIKALAGSTVCDTKDLDAEVYGNPPVPALDYEILDCLPFNGVINSDIDVEWSGPGIMNNYPISNQVAITSGGTYTAMVTYQGICSSNSEITVPEAFDFESFEGGCDSICLSDLQNPGICLPGIPNDPNNPFTHWEWKLDGVSISGHSGTGEIECLDIIPTYLDKSISLLVERGACSEESPLFYISEKVGPECNTCPSDFKLNWIADLSKIECVYEHGQVDKIIHIEFTLLIPDGFEYCDENPIFEDGSLSNATYDYDPTSNTLSIIGDYHITNVSGFEEDFVIRGVINLCQEGNLGITCPAEFEIAKINCSDGCAMDPCSDGVTCTGSIHFITITAQHEAEYIACVTLPEDTDPNDDCDYGDFIIYVKRNNVLIHTEHVSLNSVQYNQYCFDFYDSPLTQLPCFEIEIYNQCFHETYCIATICAEPAPPINDGKVTSRSTSSFNQFYLVPNPISSSVLSILSDNKLKTSIKIDLIDINGLKIINGSQLVLTEGRGSLNISNVSSGYYYVRISDEANSYSFNLPLIVIK